MNNIERLLSPDFSDIPPVTPLTESQRGVYLDSLNRPDSVTYNIPLRCELPADVDSARLIGAVRAAAASCPVLHVTIGAPDGVPSMLFHGVREVSVEEKTVDSFDAEFRRFLRPFDLENGPLYRMELLHTSEGSVLLFDIHHIVFDGSSIPALLTKIASVYDGGACPGEALTIFDWAAAEAAPKDAALIRQEQDFWRKLEGFDCDSRPIADQVAEENLPGAGTLKLFFGGDLPCSDVQSYIQAQGITENAFFLGAFAYSLAKWNGTESCFFTTAHTGRRNPRLASTIGMFVKTLPFACNVDETQLTADFLRAVSDEYYRIKKMDCISFGELAAQYGVNTAVSFINQAELFKGVPMGSGLIEAQILPSGEFVSDLEFMLMKEASGYALTLHFRRSLYSEEFVRSFADMYLQVARSMLTARVLGDVSLSGSRSRALLDRLNQTEQDYESGQTVVDLFRAQARKTPENLCLVYGEKRFTYREIDRMTDVLAQNLVRMGVGREKIVGVLIPRCEYMLICSLGVLKAGGAYLPLDPTYPAERLNLMVQDSGAMLLIAAPELSGVIYGSFTGARMSTDEIPALQPCGIALPAPQPHDLFVMLYTSGSTGTPKGVMFEHANALVTTVWVRKYFRMDTTSRVTAYASYGFDAHAFDLYPAVTSGAQLHIISDEIRLDFPALRNYFNENGITHTVMTTQVGRQFAQMGGLNTLRHLSVAGEKLTPPDVPEGFSLYNLYGPTEGSIITSAFRIDRRYRDVPIGTPVDNVKLYVVDRAGRLLPAGAVGELWIAGPHVTRGYRSRPEKTAEAYGENPFTDQAGYQRIYRTGDIVRLMPDGNLQFVGRRDAQVKVRGFRVELTEIEEVIRRFPGIQDATVAAFDDPAGGKFIAAYVVSAAPIAADALADFIRAEKPPYMVPAVTMQIDAIPLTQNQKVNKRALPVPERKAEDLTPPETAVQQKIFGLVSEIIGHSAFGVRTSLYEAGLTSIGAVKLNVALADAFDVPIRIADIKANDTVCLLEAFLSAAAPEAHYARLPDYPITETQSGIFVECMAAPGTTIYNIPVLIRLGDHVELSRLAEAVRAAMNAHPYVKTTLFTDETGSVRAARNDDAAVEIPILTCAALPEQDALVRPFALLNAPLYRLAIYETDEGNYLFMDFHHIVCDGTSETVLFQDIDRAYAGEVLQPEVFSGFEAALEEQSVRSSERHETALAYWNGLLSGCDASCLPKSAPESASGGTGYLRRAYQGSADAILACCEENGLSLNAYFNAAFAFALSRFTGKDSLTYATIYHGRTDSRLARAMTMLVRTIPVTAELNGDTAVFDFVRGMQQQLLDSMSNDACSFAELTAAHGVSADILFIYQGEDFRFNALCGEPAELVEIAPETAKEPISINVYLVDGRFEATIEYRRDLYSAAFAEALLDSVEAAANTFRTCAALKDVSLLSDAGEAVYAALNDSEIATEPVCCHEYFERCAAAQPDAPAVVAAGEALTFAELNDRANTMAHALIELGVSRDAIVGLVLDRTKEVLIVQLAILKAGGAFLPMIPTYPDERIRYCLTNAESPFVITTQAIRAAKPELFSDDQPYKTLTVEELLTGAPCGNPGLPTKPDQLAYCIYTSGSTGTPKGVMIEQHSLTGFLQAHWLLLDYYRRDAADGAALATSSISFDMSLYELYLPLCRGRCVCIATEEEFHNPLALKALMLENRVQMMVGTPSFLNNMVTIPEFHPALAGLVSIVVGAEAFPASLYDTLRKINPTLQIVNGYGPTEATICCSTKELRSGSGITIGRPTGNMKLYVADRFGHILPPYGVGELMICGEGVSRGYVKLPEKNAQAFCELHGLRAYHSGDLVRLTGDAEIEFGGRIDNQVKLRGFRVELDEIENVMCSFGPVRQSKVLVRSNGREDYLAGFFTADEPVEPEELSAYMKSRLTYYMVPAVLMQLEQMPLTPNGKIDKNGFPEVQQTARKSGRRAAKKSLEQRLCEIFCSVLELQDVYADDNFFELGGTSISASKVTMLLMSEGIEVKYGDIFDHPTPETLSDFIEQRDRTAKQAAPAAMPGAETASRPALQWNRVKYAAEVRRKPLGSVLLTGAAGFLGVHILKELLALEEGHIYCLDQRGSYQSVASRLKTMLVYYFSDGFEDAMQNRITVLEGDITDPALGAQLADVPFDTVINCAACVKHFSDSDILERINVHGVENLIAICQARSAKLVQISTVSVPGIHTAESYEKQIRMHEDELFVIDDMDNKYAISKYHAELRMLDAIEAGLRGKIVRVGNLMGRHSDGEFQANLETNMFLSGIRGFATMGKYPISHMTDPMRLSPVDCTARAVVLLAGTNDKFTAFHADNRYGFDEMKIIDACNRNGIPILPAADEEYYAEFQKKLGDDRINAKLNGLAAYDVQGAHTVDTDNLFTTNILYRIGFSWPLVDDSYLDRAIHSIMTLDYFDLDSLEELE